MGEIIRGPAQRIRIFGVARPKKKGILFSFKSAVAEPPSPAVTPDVGGRGYEWIMHEAVFGIQRFRLIVTKSEMLKWEYQYYIGGLRMNVTPKLTFTLHNPVYTPHPVAILDLGDFPKPYANRPTHLQEERKMDSSFVPGSSKCTYGWLDMSAWELEYA